MGLKYFKQFIESYYFGIIVRNTIAISIIKLVFGFPVPIILAILLNEMKSVSYKRTVQTVSYLPHFLSWVVTLGIFGKILSVDGGVMNELLVKLGKEPINFFSEPFFMWPLAYITEIWKEAGWGAIIYLAALAGIDPSLYEASIVDGSGRFRRIWHVSLPGIRGTIMILLILATGGIFNSNFDQLYLLGTSPVLDWVETINTYIYRSTLIGSQYSLGAAVGFMQSVINTVAVFITNQISRKLTGESL